ncbi:MAG: alpha/beta hydrolase-fold protein [Terriglobia bacterium]
MAIRKRSLDARCWRTLASVVLLVAALLLVPGDAAGARHPRLQFLVSFPPAAHSEPITGRAFVVLTRSEKSEPRLQVGYWGDAAPLFGADVSQLKPGAAALIDAKTPGYPVESLAAITAGDYYVQGLLNVYTEFHRSDGHVIWAHMDQWEGQQFNLSPGNLYSEPVKLHLNPAKGYQVRLSLDKVIPTIQVPPDTPWVKHVKIQSRLLTQFWGQPMYIGAVVLLPKGYDTHPEISYPTVYVQDHFNLGAPLPFDPDESKGKPHEFYEAWNSDSFPRMIAVSFLHPTPYFDDSYAVNSANNGPYGDALLTELIPYLEQHFRMIQKPCARVLMGGSTGGWESLALQLYHPDFFGGTWTFFPDPIDFRRYQLTNIYEDENAFYEPGHEWTKVERFMMRSSSGQPLITMRAFSRLHEVLGSKGRSGQQLDAWEAAYGPTDPEGYTKPLWNKQTGVIDRSVAEYMRDHGYDLRVYAEKNWPALGPQLAGRIHLYCGDMDNYYFNLSVYVFEDSLKKLQNPTSDATFEYGRPIKGHGWMPMTFEELIRMMADHITHQTPPGELPARWRY